MAALWGEEEVGDEAARGVRVDPVKCSRTLLLAGFLALLHPAYHLLLECTSPGSASFDSTIVFYTAAVICKLLSTGTPSSPKSSYRFLHNRQSLPLYYFLTDIVP